MRYVSILFVAVIFWILSIIGVGVLSVLMGTDFHGFLGVIVFWLIMNFVSKEFK